jgi:hypothetical protein
MKEFNIDLVIDKTFNVFANSVEEAKEKAILKARQLLGTYNCLNIDQVEEVEDEDLDCENEYEVLCFNTDGILVHKYFIEADHLFGAATAAEEFFKDDYPNEVLSTIRVIIGDDFEEYNIWRK